MTRSIPLINSLLLEDFIKGLFDYEDYTYSIDSMNTGRDEYFELSVHTCGLEELDKEHDGEIKGSYQYNTKEEAIADIELLGKLANIEFTEI